MDLQDTIAAIASPPGGAARGIVRLSGLDLLKIVPQVFLPDANVDWTSLRSPQRFTGSIRLEEGLHLSGLLLVWPTQRSYTRQPSAEYHTLGSPPLLQQALRAFLSAGARLAGPGEFTLRAFLAGRIDFTQAEAVLGVIDAQDEQQLRQALTQLAGGISQPLQEVREQLLDALAHLEAGLDFVDEDIEFITAAELDRRLLEAQSMTADLLHKMETRVEASELPRLVLVGRPNAGKSSLLNALADERIALVSEVAGTTRDYLSKRIRIAETWVELIDTAGWEELHPDEPTAAAAQRMTQTALAQADLILFCLDASSPVDPWDRQLLVSLKSTPQRLIVVQTKTDLTCAQPPIADEAALPTSSLTGAGLNELRAALLARLNERNQAEVVPATATRCRDSLTRAATAVTRARQAVASQVGDELVAAEIWVALDELGQILGTVYTDDMLDRLFSRFCIGK